MVSADGQPFYYKRGATISEVEAARRRAAANEKLKNWGKTAAAVVGGAAALLAIGAVAAAAMSPYTCPTCGNSCNTHFCPYHGPF